MVGKRSSRFNVSSPKLKVCIVKLNQANVVIRFYERRDSIALEKQNYWYDRQVFCSILFLKFGENILKAKEFTCIVSIIPFVQRNISLWMKLYPLARGMWHAKYLLPPIISVQALLALPASPKSIECTNCFWFRFGAQQKSFCPQTFVCFPQLYQPGLKERISPFW